MAPGSSFLSRRMSSFPEVHLKKLGDLVGCFASLESYPSLNMPIAVLVRILELMHEALVDNTITTKRDIYYKDSSLFGKQTVVDRYVDDLAYTFEVQRSALNVVGLPGEIISG
ncbi:hypothetical protein MMC08_003457 [Hypocenomyce scalaris]|nr:hypothetical protein [Hypocenomyce scalaris]